MRVLPIRGNELSERRAVGLVLQRRFEEAVDDMDAVLERNGEIRGLGGRELFPEDADCGCPIGYCKEQALGHGAAVAECLAIRV
jgi:hypothetical protein